MRVPTDKDESRGPRVADAAARAGVTRSGPPLTGGRRVPRRKDPSHGTAGNSLPGRFAPAHGAFQVLIRVQYLRTQVHGWKRSAGVHGGARVNELVSGLRGLGAAARAAGLSGYEQMCQCAALNLQFPHDHSGVPVQLLCDLLDWLSVSANHLRRPESASDGEALRARLQALGEAAAG